MPRLEPVDTSALPPAAAEMLEGAEAFMGFIPNDLLLLAHCPEVLPATSGMVRTIYCDGRVPMELKRLVAIVASNASGCMYCTAHTAHGAARDGIEDRRQEAVWAFESSELFTPAEKSALRVALGGGQSPCAVTDEQFADLRQHYEAPEIVEIVNVIALFGFLNRFNAIMATELEASPLNFGTEKLTGHGWQPGVHSGAQ
jgi:uncharacterized peroxidase-related enzyme